MAQRRQTLVNDSLDTSLSISIVGYHPKEGELESALASLVTALEEYAPAVEDKKKPTANISIIDNSESNEVSLTQFVNQQPRLSKLDCELRLLQGHGNIGYGAGHNLAITKAASAFFLLMNSDIEVDKKSIAEGVRYLLENEDVAVVSPLAKFDDNSKQFLCKQPPTVFDFFLRGFMPSFIKKLFASRLSNFEMRSLSEEQATKDIPIVSGCFMLCRTEALQKAAGFDEDYFLYFEDFDLSMRLSESYSLAYLPSMKITHHGGHSARKGLQHIKLFVQSAFRYFNTYGWRWF